MSDMSLSTSYFVWSHSMKAWHVNMVRLEIMTVDQGQFFSCFSVFSLSIILFETVTNHDNDQELEIGEVSLFIPK